MTFLTSERIRQAITSTGLTVIQLEMSYYVE